MNIANLTSAARPGAFEILALKMTTFQIVVNDKSTKLKMSDPCQPFRSLSSQSPFDFSSSLQLARHQIFNERQPKPSRAPYRCSKYHPPPSCKLIPGLIFYLCLKTVICIMLNLPSRQQKVSLFHCII